VRGCGEVLVGWVRLRAGWGDRGMGFGGTCRKVRCVLCTVHLLLLQRELLGLELALLLLGWERGRGERERERHEGQGQERPEGSWPEGRGQERQGQEGPRQEGRARSARTRMAGARRARASRAGARRARARRAVRDPGSSGGCLGLFGPLVLFGGWGCLVWGFGVVWGSWLFRVVSKAAANRTGTEHLLVLRTLAVGGDVFFVFQTVK